jgi:hypothetical protein
MRFERQVEVDTDQFPNDSKPLSYETIFDRVQQSKLSSQRSEAWMN